MDNAEIEGGDDKFISPLGRKYRPVPPVVADDSAVVEMSSMDPSSSSSNPRTIKVNAEANMGPDARESSSASHAEVNGVHRESKLELFGFDSLVNILGLRRLLRSNWEQ